MDLIDTHCHLNDPVFDVNRDEVRRRAREAGVVRMLCIGADLAGSRRAVELAEATEGLSAAVGIHPEAAAEWNEEAAQDLRGLFRSCPHVVAYGEIGLDYHWDTLPRDRQREIFAAQIAFATSLSPTLPLVIHCREALTDVLSVLRDSRHVAPVVMHCFTGGVDEARAVLNAGYFLGIGGVATFKKSQALRDAVATAPLDRLLLETDCPYLAPQPWRGRRNEPSYLPAVAEAVAAAKASSPEAIAQVTTENACRVFSL